MSRIRLGIRGGLIAALAASPLVASAQTFAERMREGAGSAAKSAELNGQTDLVTIIGNIINVVIGFVGLLLLVYFLYAGFLYLTAQDNKDNITKAKGIMKNAIIGLLIVVISYAFVTFLFADVIPMINK